MDAHRSESATDTLPAYIDRSWLADALAESGVAGGASLVDIDFAGWIGTGQMARNGRIALRWDDPEGRPASVVVKVPSADPATAAFAFSQGGYLNELRFYDEIASTVDCRVPKCHRTEYRPEDHEFVLLMEDIAGAAQGDQFAGLSPDQLDLAIEQAVALHAPRYGDPTLHRMFGRGSESPVDNDEFADFVETAYTASVEIMVDRLGAGLDEEVADIFRAVAPQIARWTKDRRAPETVMHGDLRADNLLFGGNPGASQIVVVDWQTVRQGSAGADIAYLISGSIPDPEDHADLEPNLVASYLDRMTTAGVTIDRDAFWEEYRLGAIWGLMITAVATMQAAQTDRGDALFTLMAQRHGWQAIRLEPLSLLD